MAGESGGSCVLLKSTDDDSDLSDMDSMQQVTGSSSGTQSCSSSVSLLDRLLSPGPPELSKKEKI